MKSKKYPPMPPEVKTKLRQLRIKGKIGTLTESENRYCADAYTKYGDAQYDAVISEQEVFNQTKPFGSEM